MTRRLAWRHSRRLMRMRPSPQRPAHGVDQALVDFKTPHRPEPELAQGADLRGLRGLLEENALLARELARVQSRCTQWQGDFGVRTDRLEALLMRARCENLIKETLLAILRDRLAAPLSSASRLVSSGFGVEPLEDS